MQPHVERIYMSERLATSHGPDIFYEFVYGRVSLGPGHPGSDVVLIRMVFGGKAEDTVPAEIHVRDLTEVQERFNDFMDRVRKKIDPSAQPYVGATPGTAVMMAPAGAQAEPMGRYAPGAPRRAPTGAPGISQQTPAPMPISMGPKKGSGQVPIGGGPSQPPPSPGSRVLQGLGTPPGAGMPGSDVKPRPISRQEGKPFEIISYNLSSPPSTDAILRVADNAPAKLVVVARFDLVRKVEDYLTRATEAGGKAVPTNEFVTIVVDRDKRQGTAGSSKMKAAIAGGLQRMLGMPKAVLWIPPQPS